MNVKRFALAGVVVFVAFQIMDFIVHGVILMKSYEALASVWRPDMMKLMWIMYATGAAFSLLFVYIFTKGYEGRGLLEGVRYGLVIGLFMNAVGMFNQYVIYPLPFALVLQWFLYGMIEFVIAGVVVAAIYRPKQA